MLRARSLRWVWTGRKWRRSGDGRGRCHAGRLGAGLASLLAFALAASSAAGTEVPGEHRSLRPISQYEVEHQMSLEQLIEAGRLLFTTPFTTLDGLGDGPENPSDPTEFGGRPSAGNNGVFLRVNGLDSQSCNECHGIVSHATRPPLLGIGGVGGVSTTAFFRVRNIDADDSQGNGFAAIEGGRMINPPFLFGSGLVELLGKEMTMELQQLKQQAISAPGTAVRLLVRGVDFGEIVWDGSRFDTSRVVGIDDDLVVRPFGRKYEFATVRGFDVEALQFHLGLQAVELVGAGSDPDGDGVVDEVTVGQVSALHVHNVMLPRPSGTALSRAARHGETLFEQIGCADCHVPTLRTRGHLLPLSYPEVDTDPTANVYRWLDLRRIRPKPRRAGRDGLEVPLYSDLKRHDMGPDLAESTGGPLDRFFGTARLWGVRDTSPYLHDGRATTLTDAILWHGGEALAARDAFAALRDSERVDLLEFLRSLRTPLFAAQTAGRANAPASGRSAALGNRQRR